MERKKKYFDKNGKELDLTEILSDLSFIELSKVTRVEVIDNNGRSYVNWNSENETYLDLQDDGRTLKVFIKRNN